MALEDRPVRHWLPRALLEAGWAPAAVFSLHLVIARVLKLYLAYPRSDIVMHLLGGVAIAFFFRRAARRAAEGGLIGAINGVGLAVIVFGLTCAAAVGWEFAEFASDRFLHTQSQLGLSDTLRDMLCGIVGGTAWAIAGLLREGGGKIE